MKKTVKKEQKITCKRFKKGNILTAPDKQYVRYLGQSHGIVFYQIGVDLDLPKKDSKIYCFTEEMFYSIDWKVLPIKKFTHLLMEKEEENIIIEEEKENKVREKNWEKILGDREFIYERIKDIVIGVVRERINSEVALLQEDMIKIMAEMLDESEARVIEKLSSKVKKGKKSK